MQDLFSNDPILRPQNGAVRRTQPPPQRASEEGSNWVAEQLMLLLRHKTLLLICMIVGATAGFFVVVRKSKIYKASTTLEILGINESFMNMDQVDPQAGLGVYSANQVNIQTQLRLIESPSLVRRAQEKVMMDGVPMRSTDDDGFAPLRRALGAPQLEPAQVLRTAVGIAGATVAARPIQGTRLIEISCDATQPDVAAAFVNTLAEVYIDHAMTSRVKSVQRTTQWLADQVEKERTKLAKAEEALQAFVGGSGAMFAAPQDTLAETKLRDLQTEVSTAQRDRIAKQSRLEMARSGKLELLGEVLDDPTLRTYQASVTDLKSQLAQLTTTLAPGHYKVKRIEAQLRELEGAASAHRDTIIARIQSDYDAALKREKMVTSAYGSQARAVSDQGGKAVQNNLLKREVDVSRQSYNAMLQQLHQSMAASVIPADNVRMLEAAQAPQAPYKPSIPVYAGWGAASGIFLGFAFVLYRNNSSKTFRHPGQAAELLNAPELAVIPSAVIEPGTLARLGALVPNRSAKAALRLPASGTGQLELAAWRDAATLFAESFRMALMSVLFGSFDPGRGRVIVVTIPGVHEGKTTVCTNMAIAVTQTNRRVVILDADLRKPRLHNVFGLGREYGLSSIIEGDNAISSYPLHKLVQQSSIPNLSVITAGPPPTSLASVLYSSRMRELVERLGASYDVVIIDTPPVLGFSDARILGRLAAGVILIMRAGKTDISAALAAREILDADGTRLLGTILNDWNPDDSMSEAAKRYYRAYENYMHSAD